MLVIRIVVFAEHMQIFMTIQLMSYQICKYIQLTVSRYLINVRFLLSLFLFSQDLLTSSKTCHIQVCNFHENDEDMIFPTPTTNKGEWVVAVVV